MSATNQINATVDKTAESFRDKVIRKCSALQAARERKMMTVAFAGKDGGRFSEIADYSFIAPSYSIHRIQEVHATAVPVVWDLVHISLGAEDVT